MERTFALKPQDQAAWFGHLRRVIFDDIPGFQRLTHFLFRYAALEHALDCVDTEDKPVTIHQKIILCMKNIRQK